MKQSAPDPSLNPERQVIIGVDVGGTKTHATAFDSNLQSLTELRVPTKSGGNSAVAQTVLEVISTLLGRLDGAVLERVGVGIPGFIDQASGTVRQAVNLGIQDEPLELVRTISEVHDVVCRLDNDVNAAALGAYRILQQRSDISDLVYLSIGTGMAAGIILNGKLHRGYRGVAGEIGHFPFVPDGPDCGCGLTGCFETVASGSAISRLWDAPAGGSAAADLIDAAQGGDRAAKAVLTSIADHLARAVYLIAVTLDVELILVGGGVADLGAPLIDQILAGIGRLEQKSGFVRSLELQTRIALPPSGALGSLGAAVLTCEETELAS